MPTLLCTLPWLLLGAGIATLLLPWIIHLDRRRSETSDPPGRDATSSIAIIGLSEACEKALGVRARPGRLRRTSTLCIANLIRANVPAAQQPTEEQMNRWPMQAALICAGQYAELRRLQLEWSRLDSIEASNKQEKILHGHGELNSKTAFQTSALGLCLIVLAIVLLILGKVFNLCANNRPHIECASACPVVVEPPIKKTFALSADLLFDFNKAVPYTTEHENAFDQTLRDHFKDRTDIEITNIVAYTDPIGSDEFNLDLARRRGDYVQKANRFAKGIPQAVVGPDESAKDVEWNARFWKACYDKFYTRDPGYRPLQDLDKSVIGTRTLCSAGMALVPRNDASPYPGCRAPVAGDLNSSARIAYQRLDKFRELASCLAPMRHVLVTFSSSASASSQKRPPP